MFEIFASFGVALGLIGGADPTLAGIVVLSLELALAAALLGGAVGLPLGALIAVGRFPGRTTLIGTVDPSEVLTRGTPATVRAAADEDLRTLAPGGGFILSPGCSLPYPAPDENVDALIAAAHAWRAPEAIRA